MRRIDVHHHMVPDFHLAEATRFGMERFAGARMPAWTPEQSLDVMDANGIATAMLSITCPGTSFGGEAASVALARRCNEYAADLKRTHARRFGSFAVLPMPFADAAAAEAVYALDTLGADGVVLLGSTEGVFLGDPRFEGLMAELDRRAAIVFVHPNMHASSEALGLRAPGFLVEFLCDTTRAAVNLIATGTVERYPRVRWILAHAGGFLPYVAWRVSLANMMPELAERAPQGFLTYVKRFYYDTALSPAPMSMAALRELIEPSHLLFGSDFPFAPAPITALQVRTLEQSAIWDDATRAGIDRDHALALFPAYAHGDERPNAAPVYGPMGLRARARALAARPLVALADRLRER